MDARARDISEALSRVPGLVLQEAGAGVQERVEQWLAWERVSREVAKGVLGTEFDRADHNELRSKVKDAETATRDEVWGGYRFVAPSDAHADSGIKSIDLGAGHSSASETLCGRVITALRTETLLTRARSEALRAAVPPEPQRVAPPARTAEPPAAPSPGASRPSDPRSDSSPKNSPRG